MGISKAQWRIAGGQREKFEGIAFYQRCVDDENGLISSSRSYAGTLQPRNGLPPATEATEAPGGLEGLLGDPLRRWRGGGPCAMDAMHVGRREKLLLEYRMIRKVAEGPKEPRRR